MLKIYSELSEVAALSKIQMLKDAVVYLKLFLWIVIIYDKDQTAETHLL